MVIMGHICRPPSFDETALPTEENLIEIKKLLKLNPLEIRFSDEVKKKILICRNYLKHIPGFLGIFLQAINWSEPEQIRTVFKILPEWESLKVEEAVTLLDSRFANEWVRYKCIKVLAKASDRTLS
jgi:hypothetical protein